jgi:hypothetical protein
MTSKIPTRDEFEQWLFEIDNVLEEFVKQFQAGERQLLNLSPESLDIVERWLLATYPNTKAAIAKSESIAINKAACYVGETFRKQLGGHWDINITDSKYVYYGLPELRGDSKATTPICPHTLVTASIDRKTGIFLKTVLKNSKEFV